VVWRTQDTPENNNAFGKASNQHGERGYPQVRMVCLMELSNHLIQGSEFDRYDVNEMRLAARLISSASDNSITLFDIGFYSPGLLHHWQNAGENRHRWENELGYREAKQGLLCNRWTPRSRLPEMVRQELWGVLLTYNLVRYQMVRMAFHQKGDYLPYPLSFSSATTEMMRLMITLPWASSGTVPGELKRFYEQAKHCVLPLRRERSYPREVRKKCKKYPDKKAAGHLK
jgi:hypothetical protein